jgi:hypothetical protein
MLDFEDDWANNEAPQAPREIRSLFIEEPDRIFEFAIAIVGENVVPVACRDAITLEAVETLGNAPSPHRFMEALRMAEWYGQNIEVFTECKVSNKEIGRARGGERG